MLRLLGDPPADLRVQYARLTKKNTQTHRCSFRRCLSSFPDSSRGTWRDTTALYADGTMGKLPEAAKDLESIAQGGSPEFLALGQNSAGGHFPADGPRGSGVKSSTKQMGNHLTDTVPIFSSATRRWPSSMEQTLPERAVDFDKQIDAMGTHGHDGWRAGFPKAAGVAPVARSGKRAALPWAVARKDGSFLSTVSLQRSCVNSPSRLSKAGDASCREPSHALCRNDYQRDQDRIVHSSRFSTGLEDKTQSLHHALFRPFPKLADRLRSRWRRSQARLVAGHGPGWGPGGGLARGRDDILPCRSILPRVRPQLGSDHAGFWGEI